MTILFYHNPRCSKSRAVAGRLNDIDADIKIVEYLTSGFTEMQLRELITALDGPAHRLIRTGDENFKSGGYDISAMSEQEVIEFLLQHPQAFQRPVVMNNGRARIGRPLEAIEDILT